MCACACAQCQPQYALELFILSKRKGKPHVKLKRVILIIYQEKNGAFCLCFFWDGRAFSAFFLFLWNFNMNADSETHSLSLRWWWRFTHLLLMLPPPPLLFVSFDWAIFWQSICQASLYISATEKKIKSIIITTRWGLKKWFQWNWLKWNVCYNWCTYSSNVHSTSCFFQQSFPPIRMSN